MKLHRTAALAVALALAACQREPDPSGISREQFIRANVALRSVSDTAAAVDSLRAQALRKEKVTPAQLRAWLAANQRSPERLAETWTEIVRRTEVRDSARRAQSTLPVAGTPGQAATPAPPPPTPPPPVVAPPVATPLPPPPGALPNPAPPADSARTPPQPRAPDTPTANADSAASRP